ncbi:hypothetical protein LPA44_06645 [Halobacterium sp. KA-4]|uniref:hypothetical protein n=1 Tax=Halobacterium sp. KA-4 TaxID=2896367 RepID=UPI001E5AFC5C|nr:hypothetical protein [Halobacterium sp. KA-4]MCD2199572.1 hypothetical protein [Halobacterium sp. KA-4]
MTERSRRAFLAAGASALAVTAGCSRLPFVGDDDSSVSYDSERLRNVPDLDAVTIPATHPGPVPNALAETHANRAAALLAEVPEDPAIPNGVVAARIADDREHAAESIADRSTDVSTLEAVGGWRYDRTDAAEVRGAYEAATGYVDPEGLRERQEVIRGDLRAFRENWAYRGRNVVEAVAVHRNVEGLATDAGDALVPDQPFPANPKDAVFEVGSLVSEVEDARASVDDAAALRDAYTDDEMAGYRDAIATAAVRLERVTDATRHRVDPYVSAESGVSNFQRDLDDTPAEWLFWRTKSTARTSIESMESAIERDDYATAVAESGRALVGLLALEAVVEAIQNGEYGMPQSTDAVVDARERAVDAVVETETMEPHSLTDVLAVRARSALRDGERELAGNPDYESHEDVPDQRDVRNAVAMYALAVHAADAVPPVAERVTAVLRDAVRGGSATDG